jgi:hypothetical protein
MSVLLFPKEVTTNSGGKGGDNRGGRRRSWRRRDTSNQERQNGNTKAEKTRVSIHDRPKWTPPKISDEPLPTPDWPYCGRPIKDIVSAMADKGNNQAVHFDCILARIVEGEILEKGDVVAYIGGGRFGVVHFNNPGVIKKFTIKKILEWENKDNRAEWRIKVSDCYSIT